MNLAPLVPNEVACVSPFEFQSFLFRLPTNSVVIKRSTLRSPRTICNSANHIAVPNVGFGSRAALRRRRRIVGYFLDLGHLRDLQCRDRRAVETNRAKPGYRYPGGLIYGGCAERAV